MTEWVRLALLLNIFALGCSSTLLQAQQLALPLQESGFLSENRENEKVGYKHKRNFAKCSELSPSAPHLLDNIPCTKIYRELFLEVLAPEPHGSSRQ